MTGPSLNDPRFADLPPFQPTRARVWGWEDAAVLLGGAIDDGAPLDLAVVAGALREAASPTAVLDAAYARLAPGGVLLIVEPMRADAAPWAMRHVEALDLAAAIDRARGGHTAPVFRRLQVGSVIQGYGLVDLHFAAAFPDAPADGGPFLDLFAGAPEGLREEAERLSRAIVDGGLGLPPYHRVWGTKRA